MSLTLFLAAALGGCATPHIKLLNRAVVILAKPGETKLNFRWKVGVCRPGYVDCRFVFGDWANTRLEATMPATPAGFVSSATFTPQVEQRVSTPTATLIVEWGTDLTWAPNQPPMPAASVAPAPAPAYRDPLAYCEYCGRVLPAALHARTFGIGTVLGKPQDKRPRPYHLSATGEWIAWFEIGTATGMYQEASLRFMPKKGIEVKPGARLLIVSVKVPGQHGGELVAFPLPAE